ncbi:MAG: hydrogenase maturation protease [Eggerthellaceae bacterium]|nr:hydrogenase maturation protease [Eggerthellaceae bacterium]
MSKAAVFFIGNKLMLDDGVGAAAYALMNDTFEKSPQVDMFDVGCLTMDMLGMVNEYDFILTVDAVDGTDAAPGTVFRYSPKEMRRNTGAVSSLHELKLADLFDAASLLGYECDGYCVGVQVSNAVPTQVCIGLTPDVQKALPLLVEAAAAELYRHGFELKRR